MSLTKKMLKAFGIEDDVIDQIIDAHTETTDALKAERDRQRAKADNGAEEIGKLREQLDEAKRQAEGASDTGDYDKLKEQFDAEHEELEGLRESNERLKEEFAAYKDDVESRETQRKKASAYERLLADAGIAQKYVSPVLRTARLDEIELDEDGAIKGAEDLIEQVKRDWPEFVATTHTKGADTENPPTNGKTAEGAHDRAIRIAKERHERLYGKSEE